MPLNIVANGVVGWSIDEAAADGFVESLGAGRYQINSGATSGAAIQVVGVAYSLDFTSQPVAAIASSIVTVSTAVVALNTPVNFGCTLTLKNTSGNAADLGGPDVTAGGGFGLAASASITLDIAPGAVIYAIRSAASDATIAVLRT